MTPGRILHNRIKRLLLGCVTETRYCSLPTLQRGDQTIIDLWGGDPVCPYAHLHISVAALT
ncbi:hypothetical protein BOTCAL_0016g00610 [Botryotinia calthae]|uniref:Uncharacterized protein n=1 Tax=Botryotinia calthae TaxID=38488 RepID=A0A4Y8DHS3_9HELO|nr:hypothetical protein BOTCAL_0016g00610 [Botryotinia calthae]